MKHERVKKTLVFSLIQVTVVGIAISQLIMLFREQIISLYIASDAQNKSELIALCHDRMQILLNTYFLCGVMEVVMGVMRGLGYSISPMLISLTGACAFRIFWRYVFFPLEPLNTPQGLLLCFPLSWIITILMLIVLFLVAWKKLKIMFAVTKENANRDSKA